MANPKISASRAMSVALASFLLLADTMADAAETHLVDPVAAVDPASATAAAKDVAPIPFEQPVGSMTLSGEDDSLDLTFSVGEAAAREGGLLQIGYTNAVSILPDTARLEVEVNGKTAGTVPVRSPNGVRVESFPLGAGVLQAGRNRVRLHVVQHHRVDCSLDATYELWTRIAPEKSGFVGKNTLHFVDGMDLLSVGKTRDGFTDLRLIARPGDDPATVDAALPVIQSLALALDRRDVKVSLGEQAGEGPGIDLYVGQPGASGFAVHDGASPGRAAVVLPGSTPQEIEAGLVAALSGPLKPALDSGILRGEAGVLKAEAGKQFRLSDAGYRSRPFAGRLSRTRFEVDMPADFYPGDYDTMNFYLSGATAPGLVPGAQLLVRVNDRVVTSFPFRDTRGQTFRDQRIELPLRAFRPGMNRVELLAELPVAADAACKPAERQEDKPRFVLLEESRLEIPALARIGRLPDLSALAGAAYPYADGKPFALVVDQPSAQSLSAALTTLTRLALAAGKPLPATLSYGTPDEATAGNLLFVSASHEGGMPGPEANGPALDVDTMTTAATGHADQMISTGSQKLLEAFASDAAKAKDGSLTARLQEALSRVSARFNSWLRYQDAPAAPLPPAGERLISIGQSKAPSGDGVWTRIEAGSPQALDAGFSVLARPEAWARLEGGLAVIGSQDKALSTEAAGSRFIHDLDDWSFGNLRRLAASWFSDNFQIYVLLVLALMAGFGLWLGFAVPRAGVRSKG